MFLAISGLHFGFSQSSIAGLVICGLLGMMSITGWCVLWAKWRFLARARDANADFQASLGDSVHPLSVFQIRQRHELSPMYHVYHAGCRELSFHLLGIDEPDATFARRLKAAGRISPASMAAVSAAMDRAAGDAAVRLEGRLGVVATIVSGAPFLGLLGTIWGIMDGFAGLADSGPHSANVVATLQALAPGLAAALLTTLVGLLVAIPCLFGYNFTVSRVRDHIARLDGFAADFGSILDRLFVDHRQSLPEELPSLGSLVAAPHVPGFAGPAAATTAPASRL